MVARCSELRSSRGLARAFVAMLAFALSVALATGGTLPSWVTLLGIEPPHACHCSTEHHDCVCARCHTDPDAAMRVSEETLSNRCGDDDVSIGGKPIICVTRAAPGVPVATLESRLRAPTAVAGVPILARPKPPTPPPRSHA